jgi:hypothetical protein
MALYSVSFRLQRIRTEFAYVRVPVTEDLVKPDENGVGRIVVPDMVQRATEMGQLPDVEWYLEDQTIQLHPIQKAPEPGERSL